MECAPIRARRALWSLALKSSLISLRRPRLDETEFSTTTQKRVGAGDGLRTRYLNLGKVALYRVSYSRSRRLGAVYWNVFTGPLSGPGRSPRSATGLQRRGQGVHRRPVRHRLG